VQVLAAAAATGWLLVRNRRRIDWEELAPAVVLFALTLTAYRFVLFWGLALVPVLARAMSGPCEPPRASPALRAVAPSALAAAVALSLSVSPTRFASSLPLEGIAKLRATAVTGTVFGYFPWGGPLIDAGHPGWRVAYDGRYYRYGREEWRRYFGTVRGEVGPAELDRLYHPAAYLLSRDADARLIAALRAQPSAWREIYADRVCVVFVRGA
jgi:hypothetical protein